MGVGYLGVRIFVPYMYVYILRAFVYVSVCMYMCVWILFIFAGHVYI